MRRRGLLLDRDGIVNIDTGYVGTRERFVFQVGLFPFLRASQDRGYRLAIVTNQAGVARGYYTRDGYEELTAWMLDALRQEGISVDLVLACFTHRDGVVPELRRDSFWRKPNPGMILEAALRLNLDLPRSAMIGDSEKDMIAALQAGVGTCLFMNAKKRIELEGVRSVNGFDQAFEALD